LEHQQQRTQDRCKSGYKNCITSTSQEFVHK
jgi:hypothetical protein